MSVDLLRELFHVTDDGRLISKVYKPRRPVGSEAGWVEPTGYRRVQIGKRRLWAHRVIFALANGRWPSAHIDHINGDVSDNRPGNLREAHGGINNQNLRKANRSSKSGVLGVTYLEKKNRYVARIKLRGKRVHIGTYKTAREAHMAYVYAKRRLHEGCTI